MFGRSFSCLLALWLMVLPGLLHGQSGDRADRTSDRPPVLAPDLDVPGLPAVRSRIPEPFPPWPRRPVAPPGTFGLPELAKAAGMIFSARVAAVARHPATGGQAMETVAVTFHVENVIRGATPGEDFTITQWIGLWSGGQRYRIGDHGVFFFYPPSRLGLTSCVGGPIGRFNLDPQGRVLISAQQLSAFRQDPVLGGKSRVSFNDFVRAVRQASEEE